MAEGGGRRLVFTASDRDADDAVGLTWCHVDAYDDVPLNTTIRTGEPLFGALGDLAHRFAPFVELQRGTGSVALAAVPITAAGQTLGGFVLFFARPQEFGPEQRSTLLRTGAELGAALRRAQRGNERTNLGLDDATVPLGASIAVHQVPAEIGGVAGARRFLRTTLRGWKVDEETTDTAVLCLSELVTNAVVHTHGGCVVRVLLDGDVLTTTVHDTGRTSPGSVEPVEDPLQVHGRGLQLVDHLASRWGSELDSVGARVWFALEL
jgi:anti-sigma regulatory factor (Ser/Thr protein kinase)